MSGVRVQEAGVRVQGTQGVEPLTSCMFNRDAERNAKEFTTELRSTRENEGMEPQMDAAKRRLLRWTAGHGLSTN